MRIAQVLPEFNEGGVERHVLLLSNELARRGHQVLIISAGGKLEKDLKGVQHWKLPVHRKNPFTGAYCALKIALCSKKEQWHVIHAHSRVPAWISWWSSILSRIPWMTTCHARYSLNSGLIPYRYSKQSICVSNVVRDHLKTVLPRRIHVIYNGLSEPELMWVPKPSSPICKLLFIGRLTRIKGIDLLLKSLKNVKGRWILDIVGDGPLAEELKRYIDQNDFGGQVFFHGFRNDVDQWMAKCSFLVFPSLDEGMPLTLCRAVQMGVPLIASDIPAVKEVLAGYGRLFKSGDEVSLTSMISNALGQNPEIFIGKSRIINSIQVMTDQVEKVYLEEQKKNLY